MMNQPKIVVRKRLTEDTPLKDVLRWMVLEEKILEATGEYQDKVRAESLARARSVLSQNVRTLAEKRMVVQKKLEVAHASANGASNGAHLAPRSKRGKVAKKTRAKR